MDDDGVVLVVIVVFLFPLLFALGGRCPRSSNGDADLGACGRLFLLVDVVVVVDFVAVFLFVEFVEDDDDDDDAVDEEILALRTVLFFVWDKVAVRPILLQLLPL